MMVEVGHLRDGRTRSARYTFGTVASGVAVNWNFVARQVRGTKRPVVIGKTQENKISLANRHAVTFSHLGRLFQRRLREESGSGRD